MTTPGSPCRSGPTARSRTSPRPSWTTTSAPARSAGGSRAGIQVVRARLRFEAVDRVPDLGPAVVALLAADPTNPAGPTATPPSPPTAPSPPTRAARPRPSRRRAVVVAAAAAAGVIAGATFVGLDPDPPSLAAADVPGRVVAGQDDVTAVEGRYRISEPGDGGRTFDAELTYRAPESLALRVEETTAGVPAADRTDGTLVVDGDRWWHEADRRCSPAPGLVRCPDASLRWSQLVTGREPVLRMPLPCPSSWWSPSTPSRSPPPPPDWDAHRGRPPCRRRHRHRRPGVRASRRAVVRSRPAHRDPGDTVELWLDSEHLVPLAVVVRAGDDPGPGRVGGLHRPGRGTGRRRVARRGRGGADQPDGHDRTRACPTASPRRAPTPASSRPPAVT